MAEDEVQAEPPVAAPAPAPEPEPAVQAPVSTYDPFTGVGGAYVIGPDGNRVRVS